MDQKSLFLLILTVLPILFQSGSSSSILFVMTFGSRSHKNVIYPVAVSLAERGHDITFISPFKSSKPVKNIEDIVPQYVYPYFKDVHSIGILQRENRNPFTIFNNVNEQVREGCNRTFASPEIQKFLQTAKHFDLIVINGFQNDCALGFVYVYKCPFIYINPGGFYAWNTENTGNPSAVQYQSPGLGSRLMYTLLWDVLSFCRRYFFVPTVERIVQQYLPGIPPLRDIDKNVSMVLLNEHFSIAHPKPLLPNLIQIACLHCKEATPLSEDLEEFMSGSGDHGVIYFSMGTVNKNMPEKYRRVFAETFSKLPQRVIWKHDSDTLAGVSDNVLVRTWLPQQDILAHPKLRVFITHGGLLSLLETVYHGVPVISLPVFGDQDANAAESEQRGFGIKLEIVGLTSDRLLAAIKKVLSDPRFAENVKSHSVLLKDQPELPMTRAVYWIEYVLRHKGAPHLRTTAMDLPWYKFHSIDVLTVIGLVIITTIILLWVGLRICFRICFGKRKRKED